MQPAINGTAGTERAVLGNAGRSAADLRQVTATETGRTNAAPSGTAGNSHSVFGGTRFTNAGVSGTHANAAQSTVNAQEQNHISINNRQNTPSVAPAANTSNAASSVVTPASGSLERTRTQMDVTRSTQRPPSASKPEKGEVGASAAATATTQKEHTEPSRSGMAGSAAQPTRQTLREPRHGRNPSSAEGTRRSETARPAPPARQEAKSVSSETRVTERAKSAPTSAGTAGSVSRNAQLSQTRQTARSQTARSGAVPAAASGHDGKRIVPTAESARKKHSAQMKQEGSSRETKAGGDGHG